VLDTSLPSQLSTGPSYLVHPDRQRRANGAKTCDVPATAQSSFAKKRLPTPFISSTPFISFLYFEISPFPRNEK
jgi:hypothetical protein